MSLVLPRKLLSGEKTVPTITCSSRGVIGTRLKNRLFAFTEHDGLILVPVSQRLLVILFELLSLIFFIIFYFFIPSSIRSNWGPSGMKPLTSSLKYSRSTKKRTCWSSLTGWKTSRANWNILCIVMYRSMFLHGLTLSLCSRAH